ncbi:MULTISPECIES: type VI secretion system baseplate subunit TssK [Pseudomonas]|uniref:Type VI secretion system baseplate subunit TssK n=1 Tax=Pseudomonas hamedanensis TaxID=2745504 RepID=A0A9E6TES1_9PSED|nr:MULTISPECIES: type VI secretion system baseplate subunit TssK [Pseudomonas]MBC3205976.1 type VI secretion system baseplate subunit TssK [Pseudomonas sp. SWRI111]MBC3269311.1 type VI secretion system baseplate subunit TssK [Pseudomonas sp. SWRI81]MBC3777590.1 type VI secretion system baseplate subunit TssK [Pseudomonas sp. SWRI99]QXI15876.1 type VI secretion system baseplate subunit TssK [Pseudomonas hamedanensis]
MNTHKVIWQEGMLLRPQHFQHNDRYYDHQMKTRTQLLGGYTWGFLNLEIDLQFLNMGKLVISEASGILPDGSLFELGGNTEPLALDVPPNTGNTPIYLALPLVTGNHIEARRPEQSDVLARYTAYDAEVADSNAGDDSASQVSCGRPDFKLLLGEQQSDQAYVKLKICDVLDTTPDGVISLDPDFVPTYIQAHASSYLLSCLKEVISMLSHRGDTIAERIRSNGKVGGAEVGDFMMLQLINRTELLLRHYLGLEQVHPEELYRTLLTMLGDLATFSGESKRPRLDSRYSHADQGGSFRKLMEAIRQVLSMVLEQHAIELILQARQYGIIVSPLHDHKLLGSASFVLAASANCDSEELRHRLPAHLKVGPVERIRQLVNLHLPGIKVKPLPVAPRQIAFHSNKTYFILELSSEDLAQLERSGGFAFHVSGEFAELELKFWAIRN